MRLIGRISCGLEEVPTFLGFKEAADIADSLAERIAGSGLRRSHVGLELGKRHFDRVQIGAGESRCMRTGVTFEVCAADRTRLEAIAADRNSSQKHVWRANIILLSGAGFGTVDIMRRTGKAKTCVWRWQESYMREGVPVF